MNGTITGQIYRKISVYDIVTGQTIEKEKMKVRKPKRGDDTGSSKPRVTKQALRQPEKADK